MASEKVNQFAIEIVSYSSQLNDSNHSANTLIGEPTSLNVYGKKEQTWSPANISEQQYVLVKFEEPVFATELRIYENFNAGSVIKIEVLIEVKNVLGQICHSGFETLWYRQRPQLISQYRIFNPKFLKSRFRSNQYRITFGYLASQTELSEIDAIELVGTLTNINASDKQLVDDIPKLLFDTRYSDLKISFINDDVTLNAHKLIFSVRSPQMLEYLEEKNNIIDELTRYQFSIILDYIYTDQLNDDKVSEMIDEEKSTENNQNERWALSLTKLIRFTIKYKFPRLESLLTEYMATKVINNENVLILLNDSMKGDINKTNEARTSILCYISFEDITLDLLEFNCMEFINANAAQIFEGDCIDSVSKDELIKIVDYIAIERN